jgi:glycosyltransferase 2 family protein
VRAWYSQNNRLLLRLAGTLLAVVLIVVLVKEQGLEEIAAALKQISPLQIVLALVFVFISRISIIARWYMLLRATEMKISFRNVLALSFAGLFATNFLPTTIGGDVVRLAGIMQMGYDRAVCLASIAADRLVGMLGMASVAPLGLVSSWGVLFGMGEAQVLGILSFHERLIGFIKRTFKTFTIWFKKPTSLLKSILCTFGHMFFTFAALYVIIEGTGSHVPFRMIAGLYSLVYFVTLLPISINGYGVQELSLTFLFVQVGGLSAGVSLTVAVLLRAMYVVASLPGAAYLPFILETINKTKQTR